MKDELKMITQQICDAFIDVIPITFAGKSDA